MLQKISKSIDVQIDLEMDTRQLLLFNHSETEIAMISQV